MLLLLLLLNLRPPTAAACLGNCVQTVHARHKCSLLTMLLPPPPLLLLLLQVDPSRNLLFVRGEVPGPQGSFDVYQGRLQVGMGAGGVKGP